jgi:hypothetical protein
VTDKPPSDTLSLTPGASRIDFRNRKAMMNSQYQAQKSNLNFALMSIRGSLGGVVSVLANLRRVASRPINVQ